MINFLALLLAAPAPSDDRCADLVARYNDYTPYELCPSEQVANGADPAATLAFASECFSLLPHLVQHGWMLSSPVTANWDRRFVEDEVKARIARGETASPSALAEQEYFGQMNSTSQHVLELARRLHWKTVFWQVSKKGSRVDFIFQKPYHRKRLAV